MAATRIIPLHVNKGKTVANAASVSVLHASSMSSAGMILDMSDHC